MQIKTTDRGFVKVTFDELYGMRCSIQESSLASEAALWIGGDGTRARMHLNREGVSELVQILTRWLEIGELSLPEQAAAGRSGGQTLVGGRE